MLTLIKKSVFLNTIHRFEFLICILHNYNDLFQALNELEASEDDHRDDARPSTSSEYHVIRRC